jgi:hypothetical protein
MAKNEARRQKQLAKKKAKRAEKRSHLVRINSDDPNIRLAAAEQWPIVAALVPEDLWHHGIGQLILARRCPDGRLACAVFLVDSFCLGVKNAFWKIMTESEYNEMVRRVQTTGGALDTVTPERLAKLVYAAVDYAQALGFPPHPDYRHARMLLAGIDASRCPDIFEFGHDGKPLYIQGPHDSAEKIRSIMHRMRMANGDYVVGVSGSEARQLMDSSEGQAIGVEESVE